MVGPYFEIEFNFHSKPHFICRVRGRCGWPLCASLLYTCPLLQTGSSHRWSWLIYYGVDHGDHVDHVRTVAAQCLHWPRHLGSRDPGHCQQEQSLSTWWWSIQMWCHGTSHTDTPSVTHENSKLLKLTRTEILVCWNSISSWQSTGRTSDWSSGGTLGHDNYCNVKPHWNIQI